MICQNDQLLASWIQHYMCAVNCVAAYREFRMNDPWNVHEFGAICHTGVQNKVISGDLNGDGDMDDPGESTIQDWQKLVDFLGLPLRYLGKFPLEQAPEYASTSYWVLTAWKWKITHWVIGGERPVFWDPIRGGSLTVKNGAPQPLANGTGGLRVFKVIGG